MSCSELVVDEFAWVKIRIILLTRCHIYCRSGSLACVRALLEANPKSIDSMEYRLRTAMHYAAFEGHVHLVKFLLDKGANPDQR